VPWYWPFKRTQNKAETIRQQAEREAKESAGKHQPGGTSDGAEVIAFTTMHKPDGTPTMIDGEEVGWLEDMGEATGENFEDPRKR
jgi:hypothetical protein